MALVVNGGALGAHWSLLGLGELGVLLLAGSTWTPKVRTMPKRLLCCIPRRFRFEPLDQGPIGGAIPDIMFSRIIVFLWFFWSPQYDPFFQKHPFEGLPP